jgi:hypothetical protein
MSAGRCDTTCWTGTSQGCHLEGGRARRGDRRLTARARAAVDLGLLKVMKAVPSPAARHAVVQDTGPRAGALVPVALTGAEEVDECHRRHPVGERVHAGTVP